MVCVVGAGRMARNTYADDHEPGRERCHAASSPIGLAHGGMQRISDLVIALACKLLEHDIARSDIQPRWVVDVSFLFGTARTFGNRSHIFCHQERLLESCNTQCYNHFLQLNIDLPLHVRQAMRFITLALGTHT
jgi:hypothetical protein